MSIKLKELIRQKHSAWKTYKHRPTTSNLSTFRSLRSKVTSALRTAEKRYLQALHSDIHVLNRCSSVKNFWSYIKRVTGKIKASVTPDLEVLNDDGTPEIISSDQEKANVFNRYFAQQTHLKNCPQSLPELQDPSQLSPESFSTTPAEVFDTLVSLKPGKAPGLDGLPPKLLTLCASGISVSLCELYNRSFQEGVVPSEWKEAVVTPVHKSEQPRKLSSYCTSQYR